MHVNVISETNAYLSNSTTRGRTLKLYGVNRRMNDSIKLLAVLVVGIVVGAGVTIVAVPGLTGGGSAGPTYTITSSGSTTVLPLSEEWASQIGTDLPQFRFDPTGGGSGTGQSDAAAGLVDIGASSSYPKEPYRTANPHVAILPISADGLGLVVNTAVNATMKLDCDMAVAIYQRNVTTWGELETTFNIDVDATGDINVYARSDASGTTATFGKWLETAGDNPNPDANFTWRYGDDESITWAPGVNAVEGNPGVRSAVLSDANGIGYVGLAFMDDLVKVDLYNPTTGEYVEPTVANVLKTLPDPITDAGVNLFNSDVTGAYPIARLLFYLINTEEVQWYTLEFLVWCLTQGQAFIQDVGYVPIEGTSAQVYAFEVLGTLVPPTA
ncbi:PstS family phosphate ABC transporter substrate-binding protein [Candidatus Thorarchaeota archaeon]|nr:MAG: PstS family phosphate ABC transporter substrate-binding protein [Candidatus Thorarchaeota archaeon]